MDVFDIISIRQVEMLWVELDIFFLSAAKLEWKNWTFWVKFSDEIYILELLIDKADAEQRRTS